MADSSIVRTSQLQMTQQYCPYCGTSTSCMSWHQLQVTIAISSVTHCANLLCAASKTAMSAASYYKKSRSTFKLRSACNDVSLYCQNGAAEIFLLLSASKNPVRDKLSFPFLGPSTFLASEGLATTCPHTGAALQDLQHRTDHVLHSTHDIQDLVKLQQTCRKGTIPCHDSQDHCNSCLCKLPDDGCVQVHVRNAIA